MLGTLGARRAVPLLRYAVIPLLGNAALMPNLHSFLTFYLEPRSCLSCVITGWYSPTRAVILHPDSPVQWALLAAVIPRLAEMFGNQ